jgi:hypothetical protein
LKKKPKIFWVIKINKRSQHKMSICDSDKFCKEKERINRRNEIYSYSLLWCAWKQS